MVYGQFSMILCIVSIKQSKCIWSIYLPLSYTVALSKKNAQQAVSDLRKLSLL